MTKAASAVLADALRLSEAARAELAAELLASLDGPPDPEAEPAWDAEISRRIAAIESGTMPLESWDDVNDESRRTSWAGRIVTAGVHRPCPEMSA